MDRREYRRNWLKNNRQRIVGYNRKYYMANAERIKSNQRAYKRTLRGREVTIKALHKLIERHPFYYLPYLEHLLKINEKNRSLDMVMAGEKFNLYKVLSA